MMKIGSLLAGNLKKSSFLCYIHIYMNIYIKNITIKSKDFFMKTNETSDRNAFACLFEGCNRTFKTKKTLHQHSILHGPARFMC